MKTIFLRTLEASDKESALRAAIQAREPVESHRRFEVDPANFEAMPRSPFAYWVPGRTLTVFATREPFLGGSRLVVSTNPLNADFRYVRSWWEPLPSRLGQRWRPWAKGGSFSPFYYDIDTVIIWGTNRATYFGFLGTENRPLERPASVQHFFRPGLTWPRRTKSRLSLRAMPAGCIFADKGPAAFAAGNDGIVLLAMLAVGASNAFYALVELQLAAADAKPGGAAHSFEVGVIQRTPVPTLTSDDQVSLAELACKAWSLKRSLDTRTENSHAFALAALLQVEGDSLAQRTTVWANRVRAVDADLSAIQTEIDEQCFALYGIGEADRRAITEGFGVSGGATGAAEIDGAAGSDEDADDEEDVAEASVDAADLAAELVSWVVGAAFGRFDIRLATGERPIPPEPEPFDPLPVCSPGMLTGDDGLPLATVPEGYPLAFPADGILVDDEGHPRDLSAAAHTVFGVVFGGDGDARWEEAAALIDPRGRDVRAWLAKGFFELHVRRYSKSRRKAPIYWQLSTPSASYSVWLYIHRATSDTLFTVLNDYVKLKVAYEERSLTSLLQDAGPNPSAGQRREIADQEALVEELRAFRQEVTRVAPLWAPDLDDGVIVNFAPLWRLVPQHRSWQREVKACWDALCAGKYDWSHLSMRFWPERVVPKCVADRSLAIAHDLEDEFWVEGDDGKWQKRPPDPARVDRLVRERMAPAVKAALAELLAAPTPSAGRSGGRRARSAR